MFMQKNIQQYYFEINIWIICIPKCIIPKNQISQKSKTNNPNILDTIAAHPQQQ